MEIAGFDRLKSTAVQTVQSDLATAQQLFKEQERAAQQSSESISRRAAPSGASTDADTDALRGMTAKQGTAGLQQASQAEGNAQAAAAKEAEEDGLQAAREQARQYINNIDLKNYGLSFSVEKDLDKTLISVTDRSNDQVIRQIPSEEFVQMAKNIRKFTAGDEALTTDSRGELAKKDEPKGVILDHLV